MARRSQEQRNAQAQARMAARGLDPGPLRGAEARERRLRGEQLGLSRGQAYGKPRGGQPSISELRARGQLPGRPRKTRGGARPGGGGRKRPPRDIELPAANARITTTGDMRYLAQQIRAAGQRGDRVAFHITAADDRGTRTKPIGGTSTQRAFIQDRASTSGTAGNHREGRRVSSKRSDVRTPPGEGDQGVQAMPPIRMAAGRLGADTGGGEGFEPDELLDWLDTYADPWDAWGDLWAVEDSA